MTQGIRAQWQGDVLSRKVIGDFLHRLIVRKYEASAEVEEAGSICFALDGDWGAGKSFFIGRWATDIEGCEHPVVVFDAWKNDLSRDPLIGFIAALQAGLKQWTRQGPVAEKLKEQAATLSRNAFRKAGRAVVPVSMLLAKGLLKKVSGASLDELLDLVRGDQAPAESGETDQGSAAPSKPLDDAIDEYFSTSLDEHARHIRTIDDFKHAARQLLVYLETHVKARLPIFIIIDELDRCRPDYAIELLEGVKHLFDVRGLCFCVSTNQGQLCESIKGVYGSGFDSRKYLKRFFSFEYVLPAPSDHSFARLLVPNSIIAKHGRCISGLSDWESSQKGENDSISRCFHFVARAFWLDLRSQRQVFEIADAACTGIDSHKPVHLLLLFGLAALWHVDRDMVMNLPAQLSRDGMSKRLSQLVDPDVSHPYVVLAQSERLIQKEQKSAQIRFLELFGNYLQLANRDLKGTYQIFCVRGGLQLTRVTDEAISVQHSELVHRHLPLTC